MTAAMRWTGAAAVMVLAHALVGWWIVTHAVAPAELPDAPQGIIIDLEPVAVSQNAPDPAATMASGATPTPQSAAAPVADRPPAPAEPAPAPVPPETSAPPPPIVEPPPPPTPPPPPPEVAPPPVAPPPPSPSPEVPPPPAEQVQPPPAPLPPPAEAVPVPRPPPAPVKLPEPETRTDTVLTAPPPKPPPPKQRPVPPKPDPREMVRETAEHRAIAEQRDQQRQKRAEARASLRTERAATARESGGASNQTQAPSSASSGQSVSSWRGEVMARLNAAKPSSPNGAAGTTRVAFSVDRGGRVISASVSESSGDGSLDEAAVSMVRRASPLPAPPAELGARVSLSVPVRFR